MIPILSLVTSVKDYLEVVHKFVELGDPNSMNINYTELGSIITFFLITIKNVVVDFLSLSWLKNIWSLPIIIPDISSAMISEISILDGYFHNAFNFLDTPVSYGNQNSLVSCVEKLIIGLINSFFLFLPTSTAHIITLRRFVMQGLDAGYISGLGTIAGNLFWLASIIFGWRFFVIPWLSLDIFRYVLGFILLVKYMWDSYNERRMVLEDVSKRKIFLLNFLLAITEQTSIYPFISNLSISPEASILESFPTDTYTQFIFVHFAYLLGIALGSLSLLHFTCWFWENPAFKLYMWVISSFKVPSSFYHKVLNFTFLYLTMLSAISSIPYYGLDYTITNPLGYVNDDRIIQDKVVLETSFLGSKASDRNTRRNRGRHGRRERWKRRIRKYRTFDASLYDQGIYDLFTIEDLNYGFDRFWLRRKLRNHRVRFRFFPGPWMRSFKKQLAKPRLESYTGPRIEFFRILFEQVYHPSFHAYPSGRGVEQQKQRFSFKDKSTPAFDKAASKAISQNLSPTLLHSTLLLPNNSLSGNIQSQSSLYSRFLQKESTPPLLESPKEKNIKIQNHLIQQNLQKSTLRKFVRKLDNRLKKSLIAQSLQLGEKATLSQVAGVEQSASNTNFGLKPVFSKQWKTLVPFSKPLQASEKESNNFFKNVLSRREKSGFETNFYLNTVRSATNPQKIKEKTYLFDSLSSKDEQQKVETFQINEIKDSIKKQNARKNLSKKDFQILRYRSLLLGNSNPKNEQSPQRQKPFEPLELSLNASSSVNKTKYNNESLTLLHPLKFYLQREAGLNRKLRYYSPNIYRKFSVENNAPYFRVMMRRYFYNYKPTLRWERTMKVASLRKARRKTARIPRKLQYIDNYAGFVKGEERITDRRGVSSSISTNNEMSSQNPASLTVNMASLQKPTYNYSVVSKRASRYRYQIYKDVLQHWYYSPFNRLLLKFDVDNFIRRQPNAHFLTQKEENLLHLRRFLLSEHYNTLRWYTNMEHYRSMKTNLNGSTKSFSSRAYNQQFSGTFQKIRHLFAITPSQGNVVLKFDQPLYNEFPNNSTNPLANSLIIHEELLGSPDLSSSLPRPSSSSKDKAQKSTVFEATDPVRSLSAGEDLLSQSQNIVRNYLIKARPIREEYIKQLLNEKNYTQLTQFIYKGFKTRGDQPATSQRLLNNQEKEYLLTASEKETEKQLRNFQLTDKQFIGRSDLYLTFLKKWKRRVNDQEALKNYLTRRMEKREKRKQKKEKQLLNKLKKLEVWAVSLNSNKNQTPSSLNKASLLDAVGKTVDTKNNEELLTSGLQKAIFDGVYALEKNKETSSDKKYMSLAFREESQTEKNLWKALVLSKIQSAAPTLSAADQLKKSSISAVQKPSVFDSKELKNVKGLEFTEKSTLQDLALRFKNLKFAKKQKVLKDIKTSTIQLSQILQTEKSRISLPQLNTQSPILNKQKAIVNKVRLIYSSFRKQFSTYLGLNKMTSLFKEAKRKSLKDWRKKERALGKQKRSRKEFKLLNKKNEFNSTFLDRNEMELALQTSNPLRKKRITDRIESTDVKFDSGNEFNEQKRGFSFKRKRSPQRRSRVRRNRGVFKKRTLTDSLKKDFRNFYKDLKQSAFDVSQKELQGNAEEGSQEILRLKNRRFLNSLDKINTNLFALKTPIFIRDTDSVVSATSKQESEKEVLPLKQRRAKQRKQRYWKQKRAKYSQKRRKYRKRRRYAIGKIRSLSKQFKRIKNKVEIQNWWWKQFIPSIQASTEALWQIENDKLIQQKLSQLSSSDILERDQISKAGLFNNSADFANSLQVGNRDFKPLALPETIRLKEEYLQNKKLSFEKSSLQKSQIFEESTLNQSLLLEKAANSSNFGVVNKLYENLFINRDANFARGTNELKDFTVPNTGLPFYAGWDESLRKFVVTNRLLSRKEAGYEIQPRFSLLQNSIPALKSLKNDSSILENASLQFNLAPLQGMNAATTLYWQIPFTTYDPDQFFALGMDGFSPIGWRKFLFRHSILKTWLNSLSYGVNSTSKESVNEQDSNNNLLDKKSLVVRSAVSQSAKSGKQSFASPFGLLNNSLKSKEKRFSDNNVPSLISLLQNQNNSLPYKENRTFDAKNVSRRLKKRYRRVKKHPRTPVWFPSGPLLNQVLPVHYIYVFYKRARLPRDRYLKRRLLKIKDFDIQNKNKALLSGRSGVIEDTDAKSNVAKQSETLERLKALINSNPEYFNYDFTLRKRLKPKRKYHLKRDYYSSNVVIPRRFKFMGQSSQKPAVFELPEGQSAQELTMKWRPVSSLKLNKPIADLVNEQKLLRSKQRRKELSSKQQQPNLRVKQLRRRVQRQILRSVWRYRPRAGGFVWPGDYLKLEQVKAPKLQTSPLVSRNEDNIDQKTKVNVSLPTAETQMELQKKFNTTRSKKQKRKKKRALVEWQIQPKKYLYEKHNQKVLKRKLEKAQRFDKINLKVKELNYKL